MSTRSTVGALVAVAVLVILLASALHWRHVLENGLPPRDDTSDTIAEAYGKAAAYVQNHPGTKIVRVLGTGSMAPYIPAAPAGIEPRSFTAAWAVTRPGRYEDVKPGQPCCYAADWANGEIVMHGALSKEGDGWIMSGLGNAHSEAHWRMTAANFRGILVKAFIVHQ